jgi:hypothetical protein
MIRSVAIWLIHWYADDAKQMPPWLRRWMESDPKLQEYARRLGCLENALRRSAHDTISAKLIREPRSSNPAGLLPPTPPGPKPAVETSRSSRVWFALAASLALIAITGVAWSWRQGFLGAGGQDVSILGQADPNAGSVEPNPTTGIASPSDHVSLKPRWKERAQTASAWIGRSIERAQTGPDHARAVVEDKLRSELRAIDAQCKEASRFIAVKLPLSGMRMLGAFRTAN